MENGILRHPSVADHPIAKLLDGGLVVIAGLDAQIPGFPLFLEPADEAGRGDVSIEFELAFVERLANPVLGLTNVLWGVFLCREKVGEVLQMIGQWTTTMVLVGISEPGLLTFNFADDFIEHRLGRRLIRAEWLLLKYAVTVAVFAVPLAALPRDCPAVFGVDFGVRLLEETCHRLLLMLLRVG